MPDETALLQAPFRGDRDIEISGLPDEKQLRTVAEYDHILFPAVLRSGLDVLGRLTVTDRGLVLLGLATIRTQDIEAARKTAGLQTAFGGIAGSDVAKGQDNLASELTSDALTEYRKALDGLKDDDLAGRFARAPHPSFFIFGQDVVGIKPPDGLQKRFAVATTLGNLEFLATPDETEAKRLAALLERARQNAQGDPAPPRWTLARVILHFRNNGKLDVPGMAETFCARLGSGEALGSARDFLHKAFDFFGFWNFLRGLKASGAPGAAAVVKRVAAEERKGLPERVILGAAIVLVGLILGYVGFFTPTSGTAALFIVGMAAAGIAAVAFGLVKLIGGVIAFRRIKDLMA
ncbi:MAG: hypothetical protein GX465_12165 [Acidobacteria bacterium]|nr:hypothetical protein [Acidobacteriota bacterium]